ncbi:MAG: PKD domain-containing protein [Kineosporiaceae bacterium]
MPAFAVRDFQRLPLPPGGLRLQPQGRPVLINYPMNAYVEANTVVLRTTVLGVRVEVEATPVSYSWAYGDGQTLVTGNPGGPYPDLSTSHVYVKPGRYQVSLSTTYEGRFRVVGTDEWWPVEGTATVDSPSVPVEAEEARAVLVP